MARRGLMTLGAVLRSGRRMAELRNGPFCGRVTLRAVLAEQSEVPVLVPVATGAIQNHLLRRQVGAALPGFFFAGLLIDPAQEMCGRQTVFCVGVRITLELPESDAREGDVIHFCSARDKPLMLDVAIGARADVGMEGRRLALQECLVVRVADDATGGLDSFDGCVAGSAVVFQKRVALGERAGTRHALPRRLVQDAGAFSSGMSAQEIKSRKQHHEQRQRDE